MKKWLDHGVAAVATAYLLGLGVLASLFLFVGERWWVSAVALYLPRIGYATPLPFITLLLLWRRRFRWLWTQAAALVVVLFPIMGLVISLPSRPTEAARTIKVFSFNVNSGYGGWTDIGREILSVAPEIVLLQEVSRDPAELVTMLAPTYPTIALDGQFVVASKIPILSRDEPDQIPFYGRLRSPRFMRYVFAASFGRLVIYNVHPISPRGGFYAIRGEGLRKELLSGRLLAAANVTELRENSGLRGLQVKAFAAFADHESDPVLIAGDTNVPSGTLLLHRELARYTDGFAAAGLGFGYTFPQHKEWMRIDRVLAGPGFRFTGFSTGCSSLSDHRCVVADLEWTGP